VTPGPTLQKSFIFRFQVVHLSFGVLKIVFSFLYTKARNRVQNSAMIFQLDVHAVNICATLISERKLIINNNNLIIII
jgi:hypothetical protein